MQVHKEPRESVVDIDPEDPSQILVDDEMDTTLDEDVEDEAEAEAGAEDTGDLYGVHVTPAEDRELAAPDDQDSYKDADLGENWIESLEQHAAEGGPTPEHEVTVIDDSDPHDDHPPTDFRDRPKADRGSGGPGGL
jgi:hypothetical protein